MVIPFTLFCSDSFINIQVSKNLSVYVVCCYNQKTNLRQGPGGMVLGRQLATNSGLVQLEQRREHYDNNKWVLKGGKVISMIHLLVTILQTIIHKSKKEQ